jgi:hypothetical protein
VILLQNQIFKPEVRFPKAKLCFGSQITRKELKLENGSFRSFASKQHKQKVKVKAKAISISKGCLFKHSLCFLLLLLFDTALLTSSFTQIKKQKVLDFKNLKNMAIKKIRFCFSLLDLRLNSK